MSGKKDQKVLERQLKNWRENASYMYERLDTISLEWPTLTVQWEPTDTQGERAFVASYTNGGDQEYVRKVVVDTNKIAPQSHTLKQWDVPKRDPADADDDSTDEVQKIRVNPKSPQIFAGISALKGRIYLWNSNVDSEPSQDVVATLRGHTLGGFGLAWEPIAQNSKASESTTKSESKTLLASGADDGKVCLWEVDLEKPANTSLVAEYQASAGVNEVSWDWPGHLVASCDDGLVVIFNVTEKKLEKEIELNCHSDGINTAALSPFAEHLLVTGSSDNFIRLWDIRRPMDPPLYENQVHTGRVNVVKWSPHNDGVFASAGMDGVVLIWNINNIGQEQTEEDAEDGPPELMFNHSGHLNGEQVQELDWHPTIPFLLLSADENNTLMSWRATNEAIGLPEVPKMPNFLI